MADRKSDLNAAAEAALGRALNGLPEALLQARERMRERQEQVRRNVDQVREEIRRGPRGSGQRFRL